MSVHSLKKRLTNAKKEIKKKIRNFASTQKITSGLTMLAHVLIK